MAAKNDDEDGQSVRQWRLRHIFSAREHVRETMLRVEEEQSLNDLPASTARLFLYRSVEQYLREAEGVLRPDRRPPTDDEGRWIPERDDRDLPGSRDWWFTEPVGEWPLPGGKRYRARSLNEFLSMTVPTSVSWVETVETELGGTEQQEQTRQVCPPRQACLSATRLVDRGLADCGLEIEIDSSTEIIGGAV